MHLTNYSINKTNENFVAVGEKGSKRPISEIWQLLQLQGYNTNQLWEQIADLIIKTIVSIQPKLSHMYNTCFPRDNHGVGCCELLGFDVILEHNQDGTLKPWLLEVNHAPSLNIDTPTDREIKTQLLIDTFKILRLRNSQPLKEKKAQKEKLQQRLLSKSSRVDKQEEEDYKRKLRDMNLQREYKRSLSTKYDRIYPSDDSQKYNKFMVPESFPGINNQIT